MLEPMPPFYFLTFAKVSKTFGRKKSQYRSRKHLVSNKSLGIGLDEIFWSRHSVLSKGSIVDKRSGDAKCETPLQTAVKLGNEYKDIVELLLEKDNQWAAQEDVYEKTLYPAVAGGHKTILRLLIQNGNLDLVANYGRLLVRAVEDNNLTAVNNMFAGWDMSTDGTEHEVLPFPQDSDVAQALEVARQMKAQFDRASQEKEAKNAEQIIDKLSLSERANAADQMINRKSVHSPKDFLDADDGAIKEVRKEYIRLVKDLKKTAKSDEYKVMNYYLKEFAKVCQQYEQIEQPKI